MLAATAIVGPHRGRDGGQLAGVAVAATTEVREPTVSSITRPAERVRFEPAPCPERPEELWIQMGVQRVTEATESGRGSLQQHGLRFDHPPGHNNYFASLKSERRPDLARDVNEDANKDGLFDVGRTSIRRRSAGPTPFEKESPQAGTMFGRAIRSSNGYLYMTIRHDQEPIVGSPGFRQKLLTESKCSDNSSEDDA